MVITVEVVHTEETPYMKKLASTLDFGAYHVIFHGVSSSASFPSKFETHVEDFHQSGKQVESRSGPTFWIQPVCKGYLQMTKVSKELS